MSTKKIPLTVCVDKEVEEKILALRAQKEYQRCTISELLRRLILLGLEADEE